MLELALVILAALAIYLFSDYSRWKKRHIAASVGEQAEFAEGTVAEEPAQIGDVVFETETFPSSSGDLEERLDAEDLGSPKIKTERVAAGSILERWPFFAKLQPWRAAVMFMMTLALYLISSSFNHLFVYPNYVYLAYAWLHGSVSFPHELGFGMDDRFFHGRWYVIQAPMPAVIMLPLVLLFGLHANQELMCALCAAIAVAAIDTMLGRLGIDGRARLWTLLFFALGTVFWWCASYGAVWMYAHVVAVMFICLMLAEWYGRRRPWLVGALFACAMLSRFPVSLAAVPFAIWFLNSDRRQGIRNLAYAVAGALPFVLLYAIYNYVRWGTINDIGYLLFYHTDKMGSPTGSPFAIRHIMPNLHTFFVTAPKLQSSFPFLKFDTFGTALTFTSPALLLALKAPRTAETAYLAAATLLVAVPSLLYYNNGGMQFGPRYSLDFVPFMLPLMARGLVAVSQLLSRALIAYSIAVNALGVMFFSGQV